MAFVIDECSTVSQAGQAPLITRVKHIIIIVMPLFSTEKLHHDSIVHFNLHRLITATEINLRHDYQQFNLFFCKFNYMQKASSPSCSNQQFITIIYS